MLAAPLVDTRFRLSEKQAKQLAATLGTPLYVIDEAHLRRRISDYRAAAIEAYPRSEISFASKANSTLAVIAIASQEGCSIDVASEGELRAALAAGIPASECHMHGNNKSADELRFAIKQGVSHIVVDHFGEIETIKRIETKLGGKNRPQLVLRLAPGVDPITHAKISTGQADTKFGFNIVDGSAEKATLRCIALDLGLIGFHCHVGSQLLDPDAQRSGGQLIAKFAAEMFQRHGFKAEYLNVGGGLGVSYTDADRPMDVKTYCRLVAEAVVGELAGTGIEPIIGQEPGRSIVAESGVTLYNVGVIKTVPAKEIGLRTYVAVDGGLSDNPRPALYGSKYTVERVSPVASSAGLATVTVSGKHCETDKLFENVELPADLKEGDLLQVLCTGAYNSSMASNYNRYLRPATALVRSDGSHTLIQRRESWEELLAREIVPKDLIQG